MNPDLYVTRDNLKALANNYANHGQVCGTATEAGAWTDISIIIERAAAVAQGHIEDMEETAGLRLPFRRAA